MKLLVLDTETTGLNPETNQVIEVGAVLLDLNSKHALGTLQYLIYAPSNPCEDINHITQLALDAAKDQHKPYESLLFSMAEQADYIVAHNAKFDKGFIDKHVGDLKKIWVCSKEDLKFPKSGKSSRLGHLAYDHNIPVYDAHRALSDVDTLCSLLLLTPDIKEQIDRAKAPKTLYYADVSYENREQAKAKGFFWANDARQWRKLMTETEVSAFTEFPIHKVG